MSHKGQNITEYTVLLMVVLLALGAMNIYFKRGVQGIVKSTADEMGVLAEKEYFAMNRKNVSSQILGASEPGVVRGSIQPDVTTQHKAMIDSDMSGTRSKVTMLDSTKNTGGSSMLVAVDNLNAFSIYQSQGMSSGQGSNPGREKKDASQEIESEQKTATDKRDRQPGTDPRDQTEPVVESEGNFFVRERRVRERQLYRDGNVITVTSVETSSGTMVVVDTVPEKGVTPVAGTKDTVKPNPKPTPTPPVPSGYERLQKGDFPWVPEKYKDKSPAETAAVGVVAKEYNGQVNPEGNNDKADGAVPAATGSSVNPTVPQAVEKPDSAAVTALETGVAPVPAKKAADTVAPNPQPTPNPPAPSTAVAGTGADAKDHNAQVDRNDNTYSASSVIPVAKESSKNPVVAKPAIKQTVSTAENSVSYQPTQNQPAHNPPAPSGYERLQNGDFQWVPDRNTDTSARTGSAGVVTRDYNPQVNRNDNAYSAPSVIPVARESSKNPVVAQPAIRQTVSKAENPVSYQPTQNQPTQNQPTHNPPTRNPPAPSGYERLQNGDFQWVPDRNTDTSARTGSAGVVARDYNPQVNRNDNTYSASSVIPVARESSKNPVVAQPAIRQTVSTAENPVSYQPTQNQPTHNPPTRNPPAPSGYERLQNGDFQWVPDRSTDTSARTGSAGVVARDYNPQVNRNDNTYSASSVIPVARESSKNPVVAQPAIRQTVSTAENPVSYQPTQNQPTHNPPTRNPPAPSGYERLQSGDFQWVPDRSTDTSARTGSAGVVARNYNPQVNRNDNTYSASSVIPVARESSKNPVVAQPAIKQTVSTAENPVSYQPTQNQPTHNPPTRNPPAPSGYERLQSGDFQWAPAAPARVGTAAKNYDSQVNQNGNTAKTGSVIPVATQSSRAMEGNL